MTDEQAHRLNLKGKKIMLFLRSGYRFSGLVTDESQGFLIIEDDRNGKTRIFNKDELSNIEVQE